MKIGITGNRYCLSENAKKEFQKFLSNNIISEVHHGDCRGVDSQIHQLTKNNYTSANKSEF